MNIVYDFNNVKLLSKKARSKAGVSSGESGGFLRLKSEFPRSKVKTSPKQPSAHIFLEIEVLRKDFTIDKIGIYKYC